jgi:hypothetical protein
VVLLQTFNLSEEVKNRYFLIIVSLLVSLFVYLFYRTEKTVINDLVIRMITFDQYVALRDIVKNTLPLNKLIIYSIPGGLWVFCITLISRPFYIQALKWQIPCVFIPLVFALGLEILQLLHITKGQFDFWDVGISIACWMMAYYFFSDHTEKQNILKPMNSRSVVCFATYGIVYLSHVLE